MPRKKLIPVINLAVARRVLQIVDKGLTGGMGEAVPGEMCVEAAVCYALGEPHGDQPSCVTPEIIEFKIDLNDCDAFDDDMDRARVLRRVAIAQLGSKGVVSSEQFYTALCKVVRERYFKASETDFLSNLGEHKRNAIAAMTILTESGTRNSRAQWVRRRRDYLEEVVGDCGCGNTVFEILSEHKDSAYKWGAIELLDLIGDEFDEGDAAVQIIADMAVDALRICKSPGIKFMDKLT